MANICARLAEKFCREKGQIPFSVKARVKERPFRSDSTPPSHAGHPERTRRDLAQASGSHEVVWGPICPLVGSLDVFASRDDHARYLTLYIYRSRARFWRGCEKSKRRSGNFWRVFARQLEQSCGRLLRVQKSHAFSNFHSR